MPCILSLTHLKNVRIPSHVSLILVVNIFYFFIYDFVVVDLSNQLDGGAWTEILTSLWFGSNDPATGQILGMFGDECVST